MTSGQAWLAAWLLILEEAADRRDAARHAAPFSNSHGGAAQPGSSGKEAPRGCKGPTEAAGSRGDDWSGRVVLLSWPLCRSKGQGQPAGRGSGLGTALGGFVQPDGVVRSPGDHRRRPASWRLPSFPPHVPSSAGSPRGTQGRLGVAVGRAVGRSRALRWETRRAPVKPPRAAFLVGALVCEELTMACMGPGLSPVARTPG